MKKIIALFLILFLSLNCCFINFKAVALSGEGTTQNPFVISTAEELNEVRNNLTACYVLNNDIDLSGVEFLPIGNNTAPFSGVFNGNGKKITGLYMNFEGHAYDVYIQNDADDKDDDYTTGSDSGWTGDYNTGVAKPEQEAIVKIPKYIGLFGVNSGEIFDLHIENLNINVKALNSEVYVGAFCGVNKGQVYRCYSTVSNINSFAENDFSGGIAGKNMTGSTIGNSFSNITVKANKNAGGIAGENLGYVVCCFYNGFDISAQNFDAITNNKGNAQYNYYLQSRLTSNAATMLTARNFSYASYFSGFNFNNVWQINNTLKQPELKNNPYPQKEMGIKASVPEIESINGKTITLKSDGKILFSNDGINYSLNNVFTQNKGSKVKYYAKNAETATSYLGAPSDPFEYTFTIIYDINGDEKLTIKDITALKRYLADWENDVIEENLDINEDDRISIKDVTYLKRYLADWFN